MLERYYVILLAFIFFGGCTSKEKTSDWEKSTMDHEVVISFSAVGDVPYSEKDFSELREQIKAHNNSATSKFFIHLGDIKTGAQSCTEDRYSKVSDVLKELNIPTFIVPGDNENNDCPDADEAFLYWNKYFLHFHENWEIPYNISYQNVRKENFTWLEEGVLFIGLNLLGGRIHDAAEWKTRLTQNSEWVSELIDQNKDKADAIVVFGHANVTDFSPEKYKLFTDVFRKKAEEFGKPVLYLHGDGHMWIKDRPWPEKNILRVQVDSGPRIIRVKIIRSLDNPFFFDRDPI